MTTRRWDGVGIGREAQEGGDICTPVADSWCRMQKPTQYCKAIILQLKISRFLKKEISQKNSSFKKKKKAILLMKICRSYNWVTELGDKRQKSPSSSYL